VSPGTRAAKQRYGKADRAQLAGHKGRIEMGGPTGSLGCPRTGELTNPLLPQVYEVR
jgi:hypothetical protein